jgi:hypothetical protein
MNKDDTLEQQLDQLGEQIASRPSIVDAVMQRVEAMEAPAARPVHRLGRIIVKTTMAMAASIAAGVAVWLAVTAGPAAKVYGIQDFEQRLQTARSYHLKGWHYCETRKPGEQTRTEKVPTEAYVSWPCTYYHTWIGDNSGVIGTGYRAEDGDRYIWVDHLRKKCSTGRNYPFATELFVVDALEQMPRTLMREGRAAYRKTGSERIDGVDTDVYEALLPDLPKEQIRDVVWLNPATGVPLRMASYVQEKDCPERLFLEYYLVEVDVPPPTGLLAFDPPAGYEVAREDRGPDSAGMHSSTHCGDDHHYFRFEYNINDQAVLICWGWNNTATTPAVEPDPANPPGQDSRLTLTGAAGDRKFRLVTLRTDPGKEFQWRWSLLIPEDGQPIGKNPPCLIFKSKHGTGTHATSPWQKLSRQTLADFVVRSQRLTLPPDAPAEAALTLEQIEAKIAELTSPTP